MWMIAREELTEEDVRLRCGESRNMSLENEVKIVGQ